MKLCHFLLKLVSPQAEKERMDFRLEMARLRANTEDLTRTVVLKSDDIQKAIRDYRGA